MKNDKKHISPTRRIGVSFLAVIIIGALLLSLPVCHNKTIPFIDHLFTATSATCVTGLVSVVVAEEYTVLGQLIIILMIQIGGLGFLTLMSMFLVKFKKRLSYTNKILMQEALNQNSLKEIGVYIQRVIEYTIFFEGLGALLLAFVFVPDYGFLKGMYYAVFHSISAFCNAGFDVLGSSSLIAYSNHILVNLTISFLIIAGGLGFVVWIELKEKIVQLLKRKVRIKKAIQSLSVHTKIVLTMTMTLLISGSVLFLILENNNVLNGMPLSSKGLISFFQSVTLRTAGFASVDMAALKDATKFMMCIYMFIGGSPAGTAGGIKTVTFALILLSCYSLMKGKDGISAFKRKLSDVMVKRALMISFITLMISFMSLLILSVTENQSFIDLMFEVFSAVATVGLTAGLTPLLTNAGKIIIIFLMYVGRIGPITMLLIFVKRHNQLNRKEIEYPQSDVLIG